MPDRAAKRRMRYQNDPEHRERRKEQARRSMRRTYQKRKSAALLGGKPVIRAGEASALLGIFPARLKRLVRDGKLPHEKAGPRKHRKWSLPRLFMLHKLLAQCAKQGGGQRIRVDHAFDLEAFFKSWVAVRRLSDAQAWWEVERRTQGHPETGLDLLAADLDYQTMLEARRRVRMKSEDAEKWAEVAGYRRPGYLSRYLGVA